MRDRFQQRAFEPAVDRAARRDEPPLAPDVRLLIERLRVEAVLRQLGFVLRVRGNRIEIHFDAHVTVLELALDPAERLVISIRAMLGEVILVKPARVFAEGPNEEADPVKIEIDDTGAASVVWRRTFQRGVEADLVKDGLSQVCDLADSIHPTLVEDFYLKGVNGL